MSPEEWQVVIGEWKTWLEAVHDDLWELKKDELPDGCIDELAKIVNVVNKVLTDMNKLSWSYEDREAAFTVIAGYVTQSNVERQKRRDADLARHKEMVDRAAEQRIAEGVSNAEARARAAEREAENARKMSRDAIDYAASQVDVEIARRTAEIDERVEAEVQRRLFGDAVVDARPGRKRPLVIGS